ncbi:MAG: 50S ribosomal protein L37Ae [Candidatus Thermoplasmatota archaeon]|nr:50S ribosomal protein L37Ae [Candidatus Thermoplasmatota archaeon]MBU1941305.1 50S ribosomal protein L37Ae [Candidatus Thermoplasmatota archaeon]
MAKRTKKVGTAGRFGARYGVRSRSQVRNIEEQQKKYHICPSCGQQKVKRSGTGIWSCRKCGTSFAGGAYIPKTAQGQDVEKTIRGVQTAQE